ncbi:MAG: DNA replication/repair protein RecF [Bacteroidetes bacterium]|jgi:DNA replication and repair protein RecF|nr:DNA replication/repair protein RecF [Bacteroidota bacterium]MBT3750669.1 DNA replication/repair protein RecF [Bacteroidota bacterium]MBT4399142.1 DNA replication/repair protein RecF [Bacteroidota bacterium]MBT7462901.1 DNA replication/repair protein RecF [Bacteroidota bacterium]
MYLKRLSLVNFKNFSELDVTLSKGINCFVGDNGEGKTNLFDSIYYLSFCKSYFNPADSQNIRHHNDFFVIQGEFSKADQSEKIYCGLKRNHKKQFKRNGNEYQRLAEHIGLIPLVMVSPADAALIVDGSEERRKYINGVISQFDKLYLNNLIRYNKVLLQRNSLLKEFARNKRYDEEALDIWDQQLAELAGYIHNKRSGFINELLPIFQYYYDFIAAGHEKVDLIYQSQGIDTNWLEIIRNARQKDRILQHSTVGIHRDDLKLTLTGYPIKRQGSQGQQKTFLLALKLAQYDFLKTISKIKPMILLDDVFDKLDNRRVTQLIKLVSEEHFGQTFITDKSEQHLAGILAHIPIEHRVFRVNDGYITMIENGDQEN